MCECRWLCSEAIYHLQRREDPEGLASRGAGFKLREWVTHCKCLCDSGQMTFHTCCAGMSQFPLWDGLTMIIAKNGFYKASCHRPKPTISLAKLYSSYVMATDLIVLINLLQKHTGRMFLFLFCLCTAHTNSSHSMSASLVLFRQHSQMRLMNTFSKPELELVKANLSLFIPQLKRMLSPLI